MKVMLADDHALFREGLRHLLAGFADDLEFVEAKNVPSAMAAISDHPDLDLALIDLKMPGGDGMDLLRRIKMTAPDLGVVVVSAIEDQSVVLAAIEAGASGFIPKALSGNALIAALRLVVAGGVYLPPETLDEVDRDGEPVQALAPADVGLTRRQGQVLELLVQGRSNKEIARELSITEGTVKLHVTAVLDALKVGNRTQAVIKAVRLGLASFDRNRA